MGLILSLYELENYVFAGLYARSLTELMRLRLYAGVEHLRPVYCRRSRRISLFHAPSVRFMDKNQQLSISSVYL